MKFYLGLLIFVASLLFFVKCSSEELAPVKAVPRGFVEHDVFKDDLYFVSRRIENDWDRTADSSGAYLHSRHELTFSSTKLDTSIALVPVGATVVYLDLFLPSGQPLANGAYFSPSNKYCFAENKDHAFFCGLRVLKDKNMDASFDASEELLVSEGLLKVNRSEGEMVFEFSGVGASQEEVSLNYKGMLN